MSEIFLIGWPENPWSFNAEIYSDWTDFQTRQSGKFRPKNEKPSSLWIVRCSTLLSHLESLLKELSHTHAHHQIFFIEYEAIPPITLVHLCNQYPILSLIETKNKERTEDLVHGFLLTRRFEEHQTAFENLLQDEELQHEKRYEQLLMQLREHQEQIDTIQLRLISNIQQEKILHDTLLILAGSQGFGDIEVKLAKTLHPLLGPVHLRIHLHQGATHPKSFEPPAVTFPLHELEKTFGQLVVNPINGQAFTKKELRLLEHISEAIALHIPRQLAFEAHESLELEWRSTFDAIADPVLLVSSSHQIVEANKAARNRMPPGVSWDQPCYRLLFQRTNPCEMCRFGHSANTEATPQHPGELWEMSSHPIKMDKANGTLYVHLYRNKFEHIELEKRTTAIAKVAELGVFKASLAHELNNPIGGLLTLTQLQKLDQPVDSSLYKILQTIEEQALVCRDLIEKLLSQAHPQSRTK